MGSDSTSQVGRLSPDAEPARPSNPQEGKWRMNGLRIGMLGLAVFLFSACLERDFDNPVLSGTGADTTVSTLPPKKTDTMVVPVIPPKDTIVPIPPKDTVIIPIPPTDTTRYEEAVSVAPMELIAGGAAQTPVIIWIPADVSNRGYSMISSDPAVVLVTMDEGIPKCKPMAAGAADVTIRTLGKGLTATFRVVVNPAPILAIPVLAISASDMTMDLGIADQPPIVAYTPSIATNKAYQLASGNPGVVSVSGGYLHAVAGGTATVTIVSADGPYSQFQVTVRVRVRAVSSPNLVLIEGQKQIAVVSYEPANPDVVGFTLSSSNIEAVGVNGSEVIAKKPGSAIVTITAADGGVTGVFTVKVNKRPKDDD
jgi:hypothetical protein